MCAEFLRKCTDATHSALITFADCSDANTSTRSSEKACGGNEGRTGVLEILPRHLEATTVNHNVQHDRDHLSHQQTAEQELAPGECAAADASHERVALHERPPPLVELAREKWEQYGIFEVACLVWLPLAFSHVCFKLHVGVGEAKWHCWWMALRAAGVSFAVSFAVNGCEFRSTS